MCTLPGPVLLILLVTSTSLATPLDVATLDNSWPTHSKQPSDADTLHLATNYLDARQLQPSEPLGIDEALRASDGVIRRNDDGKYLLSGVTERDFLELLAKQLEQVTALEEEVARGGEFVDDEYIRPAEDEVLSALYEQSEDGRPRREVGHQIPETEVHDKVQGGDGGRTSKDSKESRYSHQKSKNYLDKELYRTKRDADFRPLLVGRLNNVGDTFRDERRAGDFHSWGGKRGSNQDVVRQGSGKGEPEYSSWERKRAPAFNSWGGKRDAASNISGGKRPRVLEFYNGKRVPAFNSWGGKRAPSFHSWGGKRATGFNSWGGKRAPSFHSWGGKRAPSFHSWGGKRATGFHSWGGKRTGFNSWGGKRSPSFHSWGGKRSSDDEATETSVENKTTNMFPQRDVEVGDNEEPFLVRKRAVVSKNKGKQSKYVLVRNRGVDFYPWGGKRSNMV